MKMGDRNVDYRDIRVICLDMLRKHASKIKCLSLSILLVTSFISKVLFSISTQKLTPASSVNSVFPIYRPISSSLTNIFNKFSPFYSQTNNLSLANIFSKFRLSYSLTNIFNKLCFFHHLNLEKIFIKFSRSILTICVYNLIFATLQS